jgi:hypothetical protein
LFSARQVADPCPSLRPSTELQPSRHKVVQAPAQLWFTISSTTGQHLEPTVVAGPVLGIYRTLCAFTSLQKSPYARFTPPVSSSSLHHLSFSCLATTLATPLNMATRRQRANSPEFPILDANALYASQIRGDGELKLSVFYLQG